MNKTNFHSDRYKFAIWKIQFVYSKKRIQIKSQVWMSTVKAIYPWSLEWMAKGNIMWLQVHFSAHYRHHCCDYTSNFFKLENVSKHHNMRTNLHIVFWFRTNDFRCIFQDSLKIKSNLNFLPKVSTFYMIVSLENWIWKK